MSSTKAMGLYLLLMNLLAFFAYGLDKSRAKRGRWRIRERSLHLLGLLGGGVGGLLGRSVFHHKTHRRAFFYSNLFGILIALLILFFWR